MKNILHRISKLRWLFLLTSVLLIGYCFIYLPENLVSLIGIIIYLVGIQLGLESLSDLEKLSSKEIQFYASEKLVRRQSLIILVSIGILVIVSLLFLSLRFVFPSNKTTLFDQFFNLGLDCWALILGFLCQLKSLQDKSAFARAYEINR